MIHGEPVADVPDANDFIPLKPAYFHILLSVADGPVHGYGIRQDVENRTSGAILLAAGTLYETIQRLHRDRLVEETDAPDGVDGASSRWRFYQATALGRRVLVLELARLEADVAAARSKLGALG
jgi:DNA-binding PadR family transcriptional regulator